MLVWRLLSDGLGAFSERWSLLRIAAARAVIILRWVDFIAVDVVGVAADVR